MFCIVGKENFRTEHASDALKKKNKKDVSPNKFNKEVQRKHGRGQPNGPDVGTVSSLELQNKKRTVRVIPHFFMMVHENIWFERRKQDQFFDHSLKLTEKLLNHALTLEKAPGVVSQSVEYVLPVPPPSTLVASGQLPEYSKKPRMPVVVALVMVTKSHAEGKVAGLAQLAAYRYA